LAAELWPGPLRRLTAGLRGRSKEKEGEGKGEKGAGG